MLGIQNRRKKEAKKRMQSVFPSISKKIISTHAGSSEYTEKRSKNRMQSVFPSISKKIISTHAGSSEYTEKRSKKTHAKRLPLNQ